MTTATAKLPLRPPPLVITRSFKAPRERVFAAWGTAEHVKRWFSPATYTTPEAEVDFRPGGVFSVCMKSPTGQEHWSRGHFLEIVAPERLVFQGAIGDPDKPAFTAHTTVTFAVEGSGTLLTVRQAYEIYDEAFVMAVEGANEGWRTTLDKLERVVATLDQAHGAVHDSFTLERTYKAAPETVFRALTDPEAKARWFGGGDQQTVLTRQMDVRPGGREYLQGRWANGTVSTFDAHYFDVVENARLVYAYEMHIDDRKISVSLATISLRATGTGTHITVTEQGTFLDGYEDAGARAHGTGWLLDRLGQVVEG